MVAVKRAVEAQPVASMVTVPVADPAGAIFPTGTGNWAGLMVGVQTAP